MNKIFVFGVALPSNLIKNDTSLLLKFISSATLADIEMAATRLGSVTPIILPLLL
jgi:hypothetical protein